MSAASAAVWAGRLPGEHCFTGSPHKPANELVTGHDVRCDERLVGTAERQADLLPDDTQPQTLAEGDELLGSAPAVQCRAFGKRRVE